MEQPLNYKIIEQYIDGVLDTKTTEWIEKKIQEDKQFAEEIDTWRAILNDIPNPDATSKVRLFHNQMKKEGFFHSIQQDIQRHSRLKTRLLWLSGLAASIFLVTWLSLGTSTPEQPFFADRISKEIDITQRTNANNPNQREKEALQSLKRGMSFYNQKAFSDAIPLLQQFLIDVNDSCCSELTQVFYTVRVELYLACSLIENQEAKAALPHLQAVESSTYAQEEQLTDYLEAAQWYSAMAYIQLLEKEKAIAILNTLMDSPNYQDAAQLQLEQLNN